MANAMAHLRRSSFLVLTAFVLSLFVFALKSAAQNVDYFSIDIPTLRQMAASGDVDAQKALANRLKGEQQPSAILDPQHPLQWSPWVQPVFTKDSMEAFWFRSACIQNNGENATWFIGVGSGQGNNFTVTDEKHSNLGTVTPGGKLEVTLSRPNCKKQPEIVAWEQNPDPDGEHWVFSFTSGKAKAKWVTGGDPGWLATLAAGVGQVAAQQQANEATLQQMKQQAADQAAAQQAAEQRIQAQREAAQRATAQSAAAQQAATQRAGNSNGTPQQTGPSAPEKTTAPYIATPAITDPYR